MDVLISSANAPLEQMFGMTLECVLARPSFAGGVVAMLSIETLSPGLNVTVDRHSDRPREFRINGHRLVVTALEAVRDETAAYPLDTGPRTVFVVRSGWHRYRLVHLLRDRRWTIEELPSGSAGVTRVA
jgi:hypothetical protein